MGVGGNKNKINGSAPIQLNLNLFGHFLLSEGAKSSRGNNYDIFLLTVTGYELMQTSELTY